MDIKELFEELDEQGLDWKSQLWLKVEPKLRNRKFWQAAGLLLLANLIVAILGLIRTPLITWVLPKEEVGMLAVVATWMPFLQSSTLGIYHQSEAPSAMVSDCIGRFFTWRYLLVLPF